MTLHEKRQIAGSKGGKATLKTYGLQFYRYLGFTYGPLGGRPRYLPPTVERANIKGERLSLPNSLTALKALWKIKVGEGSL